MNAIKSSELNSILMVGLAIESQDEWMNYSGIFFVENDSSMEKL